MTDDVCNEFSFLAEQAEALGVSGPLPVVTRSTLTLPDGRSLSAIRYGADAPEVVLLHGAGLNAHTWDATALALGMPALAIDLAGHGDSSWRDDAAYAPRVLASDVVAALGAWTDCPQLVVGHSLGGLTAAAVAASAPELVRALVLVDITPGVDPDAGPQQIRAFFAGPTDWGSRDELVERAIAFGLGGDRRAVERGVYLNSRIRPDGRVEWKHHFAHLAAAAGTDDAGQDDALSTLLAASGWADLEAVAAPVTLIRGAAGYVTEADAAEFARRLPAARTITVAAHHNVQEERPAELAELIRGLR